MAFMLDWNVAAEKHFQSGLDRGVLYLRDGSGNYPDAYAWEGLTELTEKPGGNEPTDLWANNVKYTQLVSGATFAGTIGAYHYPDEFAACDGTIVAVTGMLVGQQTRAQFGLSYRSWIGSDAGGQTAAYLIHIIYGCLVSPSEVARATINDSVEAGTFSWDFTTTPVNFTGHDPISKVTIDSRTLGATELAAVEAALYGDDPTAAYLPLPDALYTLCGGV